MEQETTIPSTDDTEEEIVLVEAARADTKKYFIELLKILQTRFFNDFEIISNFENYPALTSLMRILKGTLSQGNSPTLITLLSNLDQIFGTNRPREEEEEGGEET